MAAVAAALCCALLLSASARASELVGSTFTQSPNAGIISDITFVAHTQPASDPTPNPLSPTAAGVVVSVRIKHNGTAATPVGAGLRVLGTDFSNNIASRSLTAASPVEASNFAWPPNLPAGIFTFIPTAGGAGLVPKGIPIGTDQRIGMAQFGPGTSPQIAQYHGFDGHNWTTLVTDPLQNHTSGSANYRMVADNEELLLNYTVEPDADGDGYGDDSQDACPADNTTTFNCAAAQPALASTVPASPAHTTSPKVKGSAYPGSTVKLYAGDCNGSAIGQGTAEQLADTGITATVPADATTNIRATMTLPSGTSGCSPSGLPYTHTPDTDLDGIADVDDNCPAVSNPSQLDADSDDEGDACDLDDDGDGVADAADNCPLLDAATATGCPAAPSTPVLPATAPSATPVTPKKCKKGLKLRRGKCVKKRKKK